VPYGDAHSAGISSIVWGSAAPSATLVITLTRSGNLVVTRTVTTDLVGDFSVSMDRMIEDGDVVQVSDGGSLKTVQVPVLTFHANPATRLITGTAPAGITTTVSGAPHSLELIIAGTSRQVTTTATGQFFADFTARPYLAGLLGSMRYTTPSGDNVYKPLFVADPLVRGKIGDWRADVILGQPDFSQITPNEVVDDMLFNPGGVYVDRSVQPNRVYIYDAGNSRVLGLSHLGICPAGTNAGHNCTSNSDCPGSTCQIQETRSVDIVLGQPSFNTSGCNSDSGYQMYPDVPVTSTVTLCGNHEVALSITEGGANVTMATDVQGNLYVPDLFNNRVLRYDSPFSTDTIADYVWGQADFYGITCNRGAGIYTRTDARSLCLAPLPGQGDVRAGVAIDSAGNLWVADPQNNRVLRFPFNSALGGPDQEADLVLGQPDFSTITAGTGPNQMWRPAAVRVDRHGVVYISDSLNNRVQVFEPPLSNGMSATRSLGTGLLTAPTGLEIDPIGGLWVNDTGSSRFVHFVNEGVQNTVNSPDGRVWGGIGVDSDGNLFVAGWDFQEGLRLSQPTYVLDARFLRADPDWPGNQTGSRGLSAGGTGLEVAAGQLIHADGSRMLFWNQPWNLTNYQAADGVVGEPDFQTRKRWGPWFGRMRADRSGRLWVVNADFSQAKVYGYQLPLTTGATPVFTLTSPIPLKGGGVFTWTFTLVGMAVDPNCDCLWLSDRHNNRVFRVSNVSTLQPVVDIVLGQTDVSGIHCNHGRDSDDGYIHPMFPTQNSLCRPGALAFDREGNLYVADHDLEIGGNWRLLEFDANTLPQTPASVVFGIPATRVFGRDGSFTEPSCRPLEQDPICGPWEPAFDSLGQMIIGFNGYLGPRFPMVYQNPLTNPLPVAALADFHSMPLSARFDQFDNLYIFDHNRSRILIYRHQDVSTFTVSGIVRTTGGAPLAGVNVRAVSYAASAITDLSGRFALTGLVTGTYIVEPSKVGYSFSPVTRTVQVPEMSDGQDFIGSVTQHFVYLPIVTMAFAPAEILFHDDFSSGQASRWNPSGGNWAVEDGEYSQSNTGGVFWSWAGNTDWTDYEVRVRIRLLSAQREASLGIRSSDTGDTYYFCLAGGADRLTIAKIINGIETYNVQWIPWSAQQDRWYDVRVVVQGHRMQCLLDDQLVFDYVASDLPNQGRIGLRTYYTHVHFDDVVVRTLSR